MGLISQRLTIIYEPMLSVPFNVASSNINLHKISNSKLIDSLQKVFSHQFNAPVWNMVATEETLIIETRSSTQQRVAFSALNFRQNQFLWRDKELEEHWWVSLTAAVDAIVLFTIYLDQTNPDRKGTLAYGLDELNLIWWNNDFSVSEVYSQAVKGQSGRYGLVHKILDIKTGVELRSTDASLALRSFIKRPVQYAADTVHFGTVKTFLSEKLNLQPVSALEYLETDRNVIISCYIQIANGNQLANFLLVVSRAGEVLLQMILDRSVTGIGLDTFFIIDDLIFFIKNKTELVSYKL